MTVNFAGIKFNSAWTKEETIKNNTSETNRNGYTQTINLIFEKYNTDDNKDNLSETELAKLSEDITHSEETTLLNPEQAKRMEKIENSIDNVFGDLLSLEKQRNEAEDLLDGIENKINSSEISEKEKQKLTKSKQNVEKRLDELNKKIDKKNIEYDNAIAKYLYLYEVKIEDNISETNLAYNSKQYIAKRNLSNPFYKKYVEMGNKMDTATTPEEREKYYQEWRALDELCASWSQITGESYSSQNEVSITTEVKTNGKDDIVSSVSANANQTFGRHSLSENVNYSREDAEESSSDDISASVGDNINFGENTNMSINASYNNNIKHYGDETSSNSRLTSSVNASHQFGKEKNFGVSANYQNMLRFCKSNGNLNSKVAENTFGTDFNYKLKDFNFGTGYSFDDDDSSIHHTIPLTVAYRHQKGKSTFRANAGYSKTWGEGSNTDNYSAGFGYAYRNEKISLDTSASVSFGHSSTDDNTQSYMAQATITDNKYGESFMMSYTQSKGADYNTIDAFGQVNVPVSDSLNWYLKGGYDTDMGGYGMLGITWNIPTHRKHKN